MHRTANIPGLVKRDLGVPKISIIIPCFNSAETLRACLSSILANWSEDLEIVVIDGGSTDETLRIVDDFHNYINYCVSEPDLGIYHAMNKGILAARGAWLLFLGSDDCLHTEFRFCSQYLQDHSAIYHGDVILTSSAERYGGPFSPYRLQFQNICHQSVFYPRQAFLYRQFDLGFKILADHEFNLYCLGALKLKFHHMPVLVAIYNDISGASSRTQDPKFERVRIDLAFKYFNPIIGCHTLIKSWAFRLKIRIFGDPSVNF